MREMKKNKKKYFCIFILIRSLSEMNDKIVKIYLPIPENRICGKTSPFFCCFCFLSKSKYHFTSFDCITIVTLSEKIKPSVVFQNFLQVHNYIIFANPTDILS